MKHLNSLVGACLSAALLAACGGSNSFSSSTPMSVAPQIAAPQPAAAGSASQRLKPLLGRPLKSGTEKVLYSFKGLPKEDGANPQAGLIFLNGALYGTTNEGGRDTKQCSEYTGCGTVFEVSTSGSESVIYSFKGTPDGANPYAGLTTIHGELYGTTYMGGKNNYGTNSGTVFEVSTSGRESVIYTFKGENANDGLYPLAGLIAVKGALYGTTFAGGSDGNGTVFEVNSSGTESVLHSFTGGGYYKLPDGGYPQAGLVSLDATLYGTTADGGGTACVEGNGTSGCGTIFSVSTSDNESVVYRFKGRKTGAYPSAGLINVKGSLYGTTAGGGDPGPGSGGCSGLVAFGCGTIFSVSTSGTEHVLHKFKGGSDGWGPLAGLIVVKGTLYGTTASGGSSGCNSYGCGTVFKVSMTGAGYSVLYRFAGGADGARPFAGLVLVNGVLYGTTALGGGSTNCNEGCGTVFELAP